MKQQVQDYVDLVNSGEPSDEELVSEKEVLRRRPMLSKCELRTARRAGAIRWTKGKRNSAWYRLSDVDAFIKIYMEVQCRNPENLRFLNLKGNGSLPIPAAECFTVSGLSPELVERAAQALARQI